MAALFVVYCVSVSAITAPKPIPSMPFPQCRSPKAVSPKRASNLGGVFCAFPAMSMAGKRCANCWSTMCHCQSSLLQLPAAGLQCHRRRYRGVCQPKSALCHLPKVIVAASESHCGTFRKPYTTRQSALCFFRKTCAKTFGERCALQGFPAGVVSPNAAKLASLVNDVPCRAF